MRSTTAIFVALALAGTSAPAMTKDAGAQPEKSPWIYPEAKAGDQVDVYHGIKIADPYRWLEDPDSPATRAWIEAENQLTASYLEKVPARQRIQKRLTELFNYERWGRPSREGGRYFFSKNDGLQNQSVLYTADRLDGTPRVLIDPNTLSADGTVALTSHTESWDGKKTAYGLAAAGSDWEEFRVRDVETGKDLPDLLKWVKFSGPSWSHDNQGFYYSRFDEPKAGQALEEANYYQKLYYHKLGTPQSADRLVYERPDRKEDGFAGWVTEDGKYLIIHVWRGTEIENGIAYQDLSQPDAPVVKLLDDFDASYGYVGNDGPVLWFQTNYKAPRGRVIAIDLRQPARENWKEVIPQAAETLEGVALVGDRFFAQYLKDAHAQIWRFGLDGKPLGDVQLPGLGTVGGFSAKRSDTELFYGFTSFTSPSAIYRYDVAADKSTLFRAPKVPFDAAQFETRQVFYASKDGTKVPMFLTHRKGLKLDGTNPTFLYAYGGFKVSVTPAFSPQMIVWMEMGGVYAVANLRGGGEYGEEWHEAGIKLQKQKGFDDFAAAAEWLIANKYTSSEKLSIGGRSNGGLLTGASITQRPELFRAALVGVGVLDMLRFHKFTIGWGWVSDYGSPDDPAEFKALYAYSPYHNIKPGRRYPSTLITTADHDDRVVPAHSFKFAAALQKAQGGPDPVLIRIETKAGHGGGKPVSKQIEEDTDELSFLVRELGVEAGAAGGEQKAP